MKDITVERLEELKKDTIMEHLEELDFNKRKNL